VQDVSNSKQLIAEKIKQSANILVTVSSNPSVDALTAALGLTLILNKLDKHATAVFSGVIPPAISFLQPDKTFEDNVDSLRDFIIALDKDKADRLRYKVEDDVVRIFITPYRTKISQSDLQFSQGDFNVDLIVALGVEDQKDLDQAITVHGRILHDAIVATINAGEQKSSLGSIDWRDGNASALSEMLASLAESLKPGILDQQISTALLTGIVANTERFSNQKTTPHVMTMAAQLMAAGANQQLIATKLQIIPTPVSPRLEKPQDKQPEQSKKVSADVVADDGEMHINHQEEQPELPAPIPQEPVERQEKPQSEPEPELELPIAPPAAQTFDDLKQAIKQETIKPKPQREMAEPPTPGSHNINDAENEKHKQPKTEEEGYLTTHPSWQGRDIKPPSMGGTLSATAEQALQDKMHEEEEQKRNQTILTHGGVAEPTSQSKKKQQRPALAPVEPIAPLEPELPQLPQSPSQPQPTPEPIVEIPAPELPTPVAEPVSEIPIAPPPLVVSEPLTQLPEQPVPVTPASEPVPQPEPVMPAPVPEPNSVVQSPTLEEIERESANHAAQTAAPQTISQLEAEARQHADAAIAQQPTSAPQTELDATPMPQPIVTPSPIPAQSSEPQPEMPQLPPMPDFGTLPPMPSAPQGPPQAPSGAVMPILSQPEMPVTPQAPQTQAPPAPPVRTDPGQFRIPGQ
jgi:hypothetical protein